jgi:hypothetical protein
MRAARIDTNQPAIVALFRKLGASVLHLHTLGAGAPDILVGVAGRNALVEIKDGEKPPSAQKLTPDEVDFHRDWRGQVTIIRTEAEVVAFLAQFSQDQT